MKRKVQILSMSLAIALGATSAHATPDAPLATDFVAWCIANGLDAEANDNSCREVIRGFAISMLMTDEMEQPASLCKSLQTEVLKQAEAVDTRLFAWMRANTAQCTSETRECIDRAMAAAYGCKRHKLR